MCGPLYLDGVTMAYGRRTVVRGLNLRLFPGEIFVLMGPSGSGKTTLLRGVAGLKGLDSGRIDLGEGTQAGIVFQEPRLFPHLTVLENLAFGLRVRGRAPRERREAAQQLLSVFRLEGLGGRYPHQLSGGQAQRVALGRTLILQPELLLLDEPFSSLETPLRRELGQWLYDLQRRQGFTALWVTHDLEEAFSVADRLGVLLDGLLLQVGRPQEVYRHPCCERVAEFFALPNRFSRKKWLAWFPHLGDLTEKPGMGADQGWLPPEFLRLSQLPMSGTGEINLNGQEEPGLKGLEGVLRRAQPQKNGVLAYVDAGGEQWQVFLPSEVDVPATGSPVGLLGPWSRVIWYPRGKAAGTEPGTS